MWGESPPYARGTEDGPHARRWDRKNAESSWYMARPSAGCPADSRGPMGQAHGAPHAQKQKPREDLHRSHILSPIGPVC